MIATSLYENVATITGYYYIITWMLWMQLTANEHEYDWENLLVVRVGGNIAEADRDETGEAKVEASAVPALVAVDIYDI